MSDTVDATNGDHHRLVASRVREELARRRISRQTLAVQSKISLSTLEKALSGQRPFTLTTLIRLEEALGIRLRQNDQEDVQPTNGGAELAPDQLGGYSRASVSWLEGRYLTLRPSFSDPNAIFAYGTEIGWSQESSCLVFQESNRLDEPFTQHGLVSVPNMSGHIYLTTNIFGQHRLIVVSRPTIQGEMYGLLTTLQAGPGASLMPVSAAIILVPEVAIETIAYGKHAEPDACWKLYRPYLDRALNETYVGFFTGLRNSVTIP